MNYYTERRAQAALVVLALVCWTVVGFTFRELEMEAAFRQSDFNRGMGAGMLILYTIRLVVWVLGPGRKKKKAAGLLGYREDFTPAERRAWIAEEKI